MYTLTLLDETDAALLFVHFEAEDREDAEYMADSTLNTLVDEGFDYYRYELAPTK